MDCNSDPGAEDDPVGVHIVGLGTIDVDCNDTEFRHGPVTEDVVGLESIDVDCNRPPTGADVEVESSSVVNRSTWIATSGTPRRSAAGQRSSVLNRSTWIATIPAGPGSHHYQTVVGPDRRQPVVGLASIDVDCNCTDPAAMEHFIQVGPESIDVDCNIEGTSTILGFISVVGPGRIDVDCNAENLLAAVRTLASSVLNRSTWIATTT